MEREPKHLSLFVKWDGGEVEIASGRNGQWKFNAVGSEPIDLLGGFTLALEDRHGRRIDLSSIDRMGKGAVKDGSQAD
jgi:hypothetical protein